jgi:ELWxxDGT repeat protein
VRDFFVIEIKINTQAAFWCFITLLLQYSFFILNYFILMKPTSTFFRIFCGVFTLQMLSFTALAQTPEMPLLKDLDTTNTTTNVLGFTAAGGSTYFLTGDANSSKIYQTDGSPSGTTAVFSANNPSYSTILLGGLGSKLVFLSGGNLYTQQGATTSLLKSGIDYAHNFIIYNGSIYFTTYLANQAQALWRTDGTASGTVKVADMVGAIKSLEVMNGFLWISTALPASIEVQKYDGTMLTPAVNIPLSANTNLEKTIVYHQKIYYAIYNKIYATDGISVNLLNINPYTSIQNWAVANDSLYIVAKAYDMINSGGTGQNNPYYSSLFVLFVTDGNTCSVKNYVGQNKSWTAYSTQQGPGGNDWVNTMFYIGISHSYYFIANSSAQHSLPMIPFSTSNGSFKVYKDFNLIGTIIGKMTSVAEHNGDLYIGTAEEQCLVHCLNGVAGNNAGIYKLGSNNVLEKIKSTVVQSLASCNNQLFSGCMGLYEGMEPHVLKTCSAPGSVSNIAVVQNNNLTDIDITLPTGHAFSSVDVVELNDFATIPPGSQFGPQYVPNNIGDRIAHFTLQANTTNYHYQVSPSNVQGRLAVRLNGIDNCNDSTFIAQRVVATEAASSETINIVLSPNPVQDLLYFNTNEIVKKADIMDITGRNIISTNVQNNQISLNILEKGVYFIKIYTQNDTWLTKKIIKL